MSRPTRGPSPGRTKRLSLIHRSAGVSAGGVLLYLLATGLPLQFSPQLDLGSRPASSPFLLDWYGLEPPGEVLTSNGVVAVGSLLYWSGSRIGKTGKTEGTGADSVSTLIGAVRLGEMVAVATRDALAIFPASNAELLELQPAGEPIQGIAILDGRLYVRTGNQVRRFDQALLNSVAVDLPADAIPWEQAQAASDDTAAIHQQLFRAQMLSLERVFQDLHSGRFFGPVGVWIVNLATLLLVALALSGYLIWWRSRGA